MTNMLSGGATGYGARTVHDADQQVGRRLRFARPEPLNVRRRGFKHGLAAALLAVSAVAGTIVTATPAQASTVRPGAQWGQVDVLMDSYETNAARQNAWNAAVICWSSGFAGKVGIIPCIGMASVCAARAYYSSPRKRGAFTYDIFGRAWCWKY